MKKIVFFCFILLLSLSAFGQEAEIKLFYINCKEIPIDSVEFENKKMNGYVVKYRIDTTKHYWGDKVLSVHIYIQKSEEGVLFNNAKNGIWTFYFSQYTNADYYSNYFYQLGFQNDSIIGPYYLFDKDSGKLFYSATKFDSDNWLLNIGDTLNTKEFIRFFFRENEWGTSRVIESIERKKK